MFNKYSSFQKAKVVRDKKSCRSRGFGFLSFGNSDDYVRAIKKMNGKYLSKRAIKLTPSKWKSRKWAF